MSDNELEMFSSKKKKTNTVVTGTSSGKANFKLYKVVGSDNASGLALVIESYAERWVGESIKNMQTESPFVTECNFEPFVLWGHKDEDGDIIIKGNNFKYRVFILAMNGSEVVEKMTKDKISKFLLKKLSPLMLQTKGIDEKMNLKFNPQANDWFCVRDSWYDILDQRNIERLCSYTRGIGSDEVGIYLKDNKDCLYTYFGKGNIPCAFMEKYGFNALQLEPEDMENFKNYLKAKKARDDKKKADKKKADIASVEIKEEKPEVADVSPDKDKEDKDVTVVEASQQGESDGLGDSDDEDILTPAKKTTGKRRATEKAAEAAASKKAPKSGRKD